MIVIVYGNQDQNEYGLDTDFQDQECMYRYRKSILIFQLCLLFIQTSRSNGDVWELGHNGNGENGYEACRTTEIPKNLKTFLNCKDKRW